MGRITVFGSSECIHCQRAKAALTVRDIPFCEIDLMDFPTRRKDMLSLAGKLSVPQVFVNSKHVGGADELMVWLKQNLDSQPDDLSPLQVYQTTIALEPDPTDTRLRRPRRSASFSSLSSSWSSVSHKEDHPNSEEMVGVGDDRAESLSWVIENLDDILLLNEDDDGAAVSLLINDTTFERIRERFGFSSLSEAIHFTQRLELRHNLFHRLCGDDKKVRGNPKYYFLRLLRYDDLLTWCFHIRQIRGNSSSRIIATKGNGIQLPNGETVLAHNLVRVFDDIVESLDRPWNAHTYKKCFLNSQAVTAISDHFNCTRQEAIELGRQLQGHGHLDHVCGDHDFRDDGYYYFRLSCYYQPNVLNSYREWKRNIDTKAHGNAIILRAGQILTGLIKRSTDPQTGLVDYIQAADEQDYRLLESAVCLLHGMNMEDLDEKTRLAFGLNLYNLLISFGLIKVGIAENYNSRTAFFNKIKFQVGKHMFSFNDVENGILRANTKHPYSLSAPFSRDDPRCSLAQSKLDCRIHFALNCGAKSCPPVKYFHPESVDEELKIVSIAFCEKSEVVSVDLKKQELTLSMLFKWFQSDFLGEDSTLAPRVLEFCIGRKKDELQEMMKKKFTIKYSEYNWSANASRYRSFGSLKRNAITPKRLLGYKKQRQARRRSIQENLIEDLPLPIPLDDDDDDDTEEVPQDEEMEALVERVGEKLQGMMKQKITIPPNLTNIPTQRPNRRQSLP